MNEATLRSRALRLSYFTVGYNVLEGVVSVVAGMLAGSVALVGFGLDSFVESLSGGIMIWRFGGSGTRGREDRERRAIRLVGYTFLVLGAYVLYESAGKLLRGERPEPTPVGVAITGVSLIVMPVLYVAKRRTAERIGSRSLAADAKQTLACMGMSASVLMGLLLNGLFGWWQADPVIGVGIALLLFREGRETIREGKLDCC
ncbi:MAG TPA: cation transporter [Longimicrobiaceae bacterium]|nr:cation transporter [Longimicrobiaceae bacterium]